MQKSTLRIIDNKAVLNIRERMCETPEELLSSEKFRSVLNHCLRHLKKKNSPLLRIFGSGQTSESGIDDLVKTLSLLVKYEGNVVPHIFDKSAGFLSEPYLLNSFVEYLYDYYAISTASS